MSELEFIGYLTDAQVLIDRESNSVIIVSSDISPIKFSINHPYIQDTKLERKARAALALPPSQSASETVHRGSTKE